MHLASLEFKFRFFFPKVGAKLQNSFQENFLQTFEGKLSVTSSHTLLMQSAMQF